MKIFIKLRLESGVYCFIINQRWVIRNDEQNAGEPRDLQLHCPNISRRAFPIKGRRRDDVFLISKRSLSNIAPMEFCTSGRHRPDVCVPLWYTLKSFFFFYKLVFIQQRFAKLMVTVIVMIDIV